MDIPLFSLLPTLQVEFLERSPAKPFLCSPSFLHWFQWGLCMKCHAQQWCLVQSAVSPALSYFILLIRSVENPQSLFNGNSVWPWKTLPSFGFKCPCYKFLFIITYLLCISLLIPLVSFLHRIVLQTPLVFTSIATLYLKYAKTFPYKMK